MKENFIGPILIIGSLVLYHWFSSSSLYYSLFYGFGYDEIDIDKEPYDCDFLTSPIGQKHCHYEQKIKGYKSGKDKDGNDICSYDLGKTWIKDCWGYMEGRNYLKVSWDRVQE